MRIPIVDENDNIICHKERSEVQPEDIYRVAALWITNSKGEILIAQRKFTKKNNPGKWGTAVSGTVEKGESYFENIIKEADEELGLRDIEVKESIKELVIGKHNHFTQLYLLKIDKNIEDFVLAKDEVEAVKWIAKDALLNDIQENPDNYLKSLGYWTEVL